jgi:hypothetical protein
MEASGEFLCPSCVNVNKPEAETCQHCGRDLKSLRPVNIKYQLVRDVEGFGIALRGRVILHRMDLKTAQGTLSILNGEDKNG